MNHRQHQPRPQKMNALLTVLSYSLPKRLLDVSLAAVCLAILSLPIVCLALAVKVTSTGPVLFWSSRVGKGGKLFNMPKFRSMLNDTPNVATHLLVNPGSYMTPLGSFLRKTSLDELPQLWCILKGEMSFVGPRPALFNQSDLIALRHKHGVSDLIPGLTGWAQVNGRDELSIEEKVQFDVEYLKRRSFIFDLYILSLTAINVLKSDGIAH